MGEAIFKIVVGILGQILGILGVPILPIFLFIIAIPFIIILGGLAIIAISLILRPLCWTLENLGCLPALILFWAILFGIVWVCIQFGWEPGL